MSLLNYLGFMIGFISGILLIIASAVAMALSPWEYKTALILFGLGILSFSLAFVSWNDEFGENSKEEK